MAGGTFIPGVSKDVPGTYFNFESEAKQQVNLSSRGTVALPLPNHNWGPSQEFFIIDKTDMEGQFSKLGYHTIDPEVIMIREVFKEANKIVCYRPSTGGEKATAVVDPLTITAKYAGTRGNDLKVVIRDNVISGKDVFVYLKEEVVYKASEATNVEDLLESEWVTFSGTGALANTAGIDLQGGTSTVETNGDVTKFLNDVETFNFNALCFPYTDATLAQAFDLKVKYFNNDIGKYMVGVRPKGTVAADFEGVITINSAVVLADAILTVEQTCAWVAGAEAAAKVNESITEKVYPGAVDVVNRLTASQLGTALTSGEFVFVVDTDESSTQVKVAQDINSLTTFTKTKDKSYRKNRTIRTLQEIAKTGGKMLPPNKYDGNSDGYSLAKKDLVSLLLELQKMNALKNVNVDTDVIIDEEKSQGDEMYSLIYAQTVDSVEKVYVTVKTS